MLISLEVKKSLDVWETECRENAKPKEQICHLNVQNRVITKILIAMKCNTMKLYSRAWKSQAIFDETIEWRINKNITSLANNQKKSEENS